MLCDPVCALALSGVGGCGSRGDTPWVPGKLRLEGRCSEHMRVLRLVPDLSMSCPLEGPQQRGRQAVRSAHARTEHHRCLTTTMENSMTVPQKAKNRITI